MSDEPKGASWEAMVAAGAQYIIAKEDGDEEGATAEFNKIMLIRQKQKRA